ncbi:GNAT family N-acetyltransferase [Candidatus Chlorohelix sp.]|uniref:GNAT family N-acetyltransferase n=1 Tax=Candidatus Chlorohelix sp. TaxID=3139201 RepID=UPI00303FCFAC
MDKIENIDIATALKVLPELIELLRDSVDSGASIGFWSPLQYETAFGYWQDIIKELEKGYRSLLVGYSHGKVVASAQLSFISKQNGSHRVELQKLMVHTKYRGLGYGRDILTASEAEAKTRECRLLFLDTRKGDAAEQLYIKQGYTCAGVIPQYIVEADGTFTDTVIYYKLL